MRFAQVQLRLFPVKYPETMAGVKIGALRRAKGNLRNHQVHAKACRLERHSSGEWIASDWPVCYPACQTGGMTNRSKQNAASDSFNEIATIRIELRHTDPLIWRQVAVPTSITLKVLHDIIQVVMGWFDYHLWEFTIGKQRYGLPMDDDWGTEPRADAGRVRLRDVLKPRKTVIDYMYDFGDGWEHRLIVTEVRAGKPSVSYPRYIGGERNGPPEDCGGIPGYYNLLEALADPRHPEHEELSEWIGAHFNPQAFSVEEANRLLSPARRRSKTPAR